MEQIEITQSLDNTKPTAGNAYIVGWHRMFKYFLYAFLVIVFLGVTSAPISWTFEVQHIHFPIMFNFFSSTIKVRSKKSSP
jgi:hypothetical protein